MRKVVITGATSMLGCALIEECIRSNTYVLAIARRKSTKLSMLPISPLVNIVECDLNEIDDLNVNDYGFDAFYHFAWAATDSNNRDNVEVQYENIGTTLKAVRFAQRLCCAKFIGSGSQAEYGHITCKKISEDNFTPYNAYGIAKFATGKLASILCDQLDLSFIWTRVYSIYGRGDSSATLIMYCINCLLNNEMPLLTKCEQTWDYLNAHDAAIAFYLLGEHGKNQKVYNIGSGHARPLYEYVNIIRNVIDPNLPLGFGERNYSRQQIMHLCADISKLREDTGFEPKVSFIDGILDLIRWYKNK